MHEEGAYEEAAPERGARGVKSVSLTEPAQRG